MGQYVQVVVYIFQAASILMALRAAWLWSKASKVETPAKNTPLMQNALDGSSGLEKELRDLAKGMIDQSRLNADAALWTAWSVVAQAFTLLAAPAIQAAGSAQ